MIEILCANRMGMELETRKVRHPRERSRAAWNDFVRGSAGWELQLDDFNPVGTRFRPVSDRRSPSRRRWDIAPARWGGRRLREGTVGDRQVVTNQIEFRVAGCGKQDLVWVRNPHLALLDGEQLAIRFRCHCVTAYRDQTAFERRAIPTCKRRALHLRAVDEFAQRDPDRPRSGRLHTAG